MDGALPTRLSMILLLVLWGGTASAAPPDAGAGSDGGVHVVRPVPKCKSDVANVVRGHALVRNLICPDQSWPKPPSVSSRMLPNGCFADAFFIKCGEQTFRVDVEPGVEPTVPAGLRRVDAQAMGNFRKAGDLLQKDAQGCLTAIDLALKTEPGIGRFWRIRGLALMNLNQPVKALQAFDKVLEFVPRDPLFRLEHAEIGARANQRDQAITELRGLLKDVDPKWHQRSELLSVLAGLLTETDAPDAAEMRSQACLAGNQSLCAPVSADGGGQR
jgi:hypothetical protein